MQTKKILAKVAIVAVVVGFAVVCACTGSITNPVSTLWSLFPPIVAIGLALFTKEVYSSLFVGILVGGLLATGFNPIKTMDAVTSDGMIAAVAGNAGVFIFLAVLGMIVALINKAGGSRAFGDWAAKHVKGKVGAAIVTFILGVLIFIDDYFNCLTVGAVMRPVTDKAKISRAKLAYLIDATAAPICMIAPISSWAAAVSSFAPEGEGISLFIEAIPYNFYSLMTFVFIIAITVMKADFGPMKLHERNAAIKGDLFTSGTVAADNEGETPATNKGRVFDLVLPIVVLIGICIFTFIYIGQAGDSSMNFIDAFSNTDATVALPWGGMVALVLIAIYFIARRLLTFKQAMECIPRGLLAMAPAIMITAMATALKNMTGLLDSDGFVKAALENASGLQNFLPVIIFLVACVIAFSTGTSWGTFGILIPIVLAVFPTGSVLGIIGMSACLAGAVCGDHCSPISDTTIMSSAGAQCDHINHVSTQIPYAVTVAGISAVGFLIAPFIQNAWICLGITSLLTVLVLFVIKKINKI